MPALHSPRAATAPWIAAAMMLGAVALPSSGYAQDPPLAVNFVAVTDRLHTAGQPNETALRSLAERGYDLVINLAPPTARDAVANEAGLLEESGVAYRNIPVDWQKPRPEDFETFSAVLAGAGGSRVLVHCQMNMRASMFTFLHRVTHDGVPLDEALATLRKVWTPQGAWAELGNTVLAGHDIDFEFPHAD